MKIGGYWEFDETMLRNLNLTEPFKLKLKEFGNNQKKAMTAVMIDYLEKGFANQME